MTSWRWIIPGIAIGFLAALAPACGMANNCNASNCSGCCDDDGTCRSGEQVTACGNGGALCRTCGGLELCSSGFCTPIGGGGNTDGGVVCGPSNCSTCCVNNQCQAQSNDLTCGTGGVACDTCTGSETCTNGACADPSCNGCRDASNNCLSAAQQSNAQCGSNGVSCSACPSGQACQNGTCQTTGGTCNSTNCSGCCSGNTCVPLGSQSEAQCGTGANACTACPSGQTCQNGTCATPSGTCNSGNCAGCCSGTACLTFGSQSQAQCGSNGVACMACPSGQSCNNGTCVPTGGTANYGAPCTSNAQCSGIGAGAICKQMTATGNATYTGGYCTKLCSGPGDCGTTAECIGGVGFGDDNICAAFCNAGGYVCRTGYACYPIDAGDVCWLDPLPTPPATPVGNPCTSNAQCVTSNFPGQCISEGTTATNFPGGYCTADCSSQSFSCGSTGTCVGFGNPATSYQCLSSCSNPGEMQGTECRSGYLCLSLSGGQAGVCWPNCNANPSGCATGTCNATTGLCQ